MKITDFKDKHKGETCYILGNGPGLNDIDLDSLEYPTFGTNRIYLSGFTPTYYACVNPLVIEQFSDDIAEIEAIKFINTDLGDVLLDTRQYSPVFGSPEGAIWEGHTVTFVCMQLAYYMGFTRVLLLGIDHYFTQGDFGPNKAVISESADPNHFHPDYFGEGIKWHTADLPRSEVAYSLAKKAFEDDGREIINCSTRTKLNIFKIQPLNYVLSETKPRVSAIVSAYKSEEFFIDKVKDLERQSLGDDLEIVIVCQDGSFEHEQVKDRSDLTVVVTPDIPSVFDAMTLGAKAASGEYLAHAFTDDRLGVSAIETCADVLDTRPNIDLVYHDAYITWVRNQGYDEFLKENEGKELVLGRHEDKPGIFQWPDYSLDRLRQGCFIGPHPVYRANVHQRHGYYHPDYPIAGDYEFWLRIGRADNFFHLPYPLGLYAARPDGVELSNKEQSMQESQKAQALHFAAPLMEGGNGSKPKPDISVLKRQPIRAWPWPRILVFVPMFPALPHAPEVFYDFIRIAQQGPVFIETGQQRIDLARDKAAQQLLESSFTHVLMLDADHKHPSHIIQRLAKWVIQNPEVKIVGGLNFRRGEPFDPCAYVMNEDGEYLAPSEWDDGLLEVDRIGTGSLLVDREVFETIPRPWFCHDGSGEYSESWYSEDIVFSNKAKHAGFKIYCDTSTISPHMISGYVDDNTFKHYLKEHPEEFGEAITVGG